jgi:hypothetical protein
LLFLTRDFTNSFGTPRLAVVGVIACPVEEGTMTSLLFTISIFAEYRGTKEIYSAKVIARNGTPLYHLAEALSIPEALEKVVQEMRLQEKKSALLRG